MMIKEKYSSQELLIAVDSCNIYFGLDLSKEEVCDITEKLLEGRHISFYDIPEGIGGYKALDFLLALNEQNRSKLKYNTNKYIARIQKEGTEV